MAEARLHRKVGGWAMLVYPALLCACASGVSLRVSPEALAELPLENRLTLLDAENDYLAAVDARDAAEDRVLQAVEARGQARQRRHEAEDNLSNARKEKETPDAAEAAVRESEARVELADRRIDSSRAELRVAEAALDLADARFEQARAGEVVSAGLSHSHDVKPEKFQRQVDDLARVRTEREAKAQEVKARTDEAEQQWRAARAELTKLTGGAQGSAWVE
ncbi:MAG TPA: hypothetical protein VLW85_12615 [Myxococcales bacterium]|nr:hypothetical protein [Myxococcales bacterium]